MYYAVTGLFYLVVKVRLQLSTLEPIQTQTDVIHPILSYPSYHGLFQTRLLRQQLRERAQRVESECYGCTVDYEGEEKLRHSRVSTPLCIPPKPGQAIGLKQKTTANKSLIYNLYME